MVYSIGYQDTSFEELKQIMKDKSIGLLVDVRSSPYSRNPMKKDFNRERLIELLGKRYVWMGNICGGKEGPVKPACFKALESLLSKNLLIMCMENHPCDCHRFHSIAKKLDQKGVTVMHLFDGTEKTTDELKVLCEEEHEDNN